MNAQQLQDRVRELEPWFHNVHLPADDGGTVQTRPDGPFGDFPRFKWNEIAPHLDADLSGQRVLDIGCNAGFYTIELARRGADVTAIDLSDHYLTQAKLAVEVSGVGDKVTFHKTQVYDLARQVGPAWEFDLILFMGVFYHLRYPLLGLDVVRSKLKVGGRMVFQTLTMPGGDEPAGATDTTNATFQTRDRLTADGWPKMAFFEHGFVDDPTNWWAANAAACEAMLRSTGLEIVARPGHEIYLARATESHGSGLRDVRDAEFAAATGQPLGVLGKPGEPSGSSSSEGKSR